MGVKWTEQQKAAIETEGSDILVSAAAGSGKTAVLTERIKRLVLEKSMSVDNMLIVTFSNAAAAEMKEKIIKALKAEAAADPDRAAVLRAQIRRARTADISTFHKFSMGVIRRYFYLTDIDQKFGICDESRRTIMTEETLDELMEDRFASGEEFTEFLKKYADVRSEDRVRTMILEVYRFIMSMPDPFRWLDEAAAAAGADTEEFLKSPVYEALKKNYRNTASRAYRIYESAAEMVSGMESLAPKAEKDLRQLALILDAAENGDRSRLEEAAGYKFETFRASKADKADYDAIKDIVTKKRDQAKKLIKALREEITAVSLEACVRRINETADSALYLTDLVKDFHQRFTAKKREKNILDFNDLEHTALEILGHEEIAEEYRRHFEVIFIDEYQDSSILQETLIQRISRGNNVYMVGDVKQSIYKFRLAEPEIFIDKYNDFREGRRPGIRIDLNRNFRSKGHIIESVNAVFSHIMDRETCGIDYDSDAELKKGSGYEGELDRITSLNLINTDLPDDTTDVESELLDLKKTELEARVVAELAASCLGMTIFDDKKQTERQVGPDDIVILLRGVRGQSDIYAEALKNMGIPAYVDAGEGYFETTEIEVFMNLLRIIDNRRNDIPLISVLFSPIFGFTTEELINIRLFERRQSGRKERTSYSQAFINMACMAGYSPSDEGGRGCPEEDKDVDPAFSALADKCRRTCERLDGWRIHARFMPLDTFLWKLMVETAYLDYVTGMPGGERRAANLRSLVDKAVDFSSSKAKGLFAFLRYVEAMNRGSVQIGQSLEHDTSGRMVRIMTIHKSKGLEFPVVILAGLGKRFNRDRNTSSVVLHKELGMALSCIRPDRKTTASTLTQRVINQQKEKERMAEEMRILYVAMTRPMDELIMVGSLSDADRALEEYAAGIRGEVTSASCYLDWIVPYCSESVMPIIKWDRKMLSDIAGSESSEASAMEKELREGFPSFKDEEGLAGELARRFSYEYPFRADVASKSKFAVSMLNKVLRGNPFNDSRISVISSDEEPVSGEAAEREEKDLAEEKGFRVPSFMNEEENITPARRGTLTHMVLELIPFSEDNDEEAVRKFVSRLPEQGFMTEREAAAVDCRKVAAFFSSPVGRRACRAQWLRKEWRFTLRKNREEIAAMAADEDIAGGLRKELSETVLIQGIIDCCFRDEEGIVIVDYKTDRVDLKDRKASVERLRNEYRGQLELYTEVIEKALDEKVAGRLLFLLDTGEEVVI